MTKNDFIDRVSKKSGLSKKDATKAVDAFLDSVTEALKTGDSVSFTGFGKFSPDSERSLERLGHAAKELRDDAEELERNNKEFRGRLARSRETLRNIATA